MQEVGTCLISHWPFKGSGRIFDQHKHGLWAPKATTRGEGERENRKSERQRWKERKEGYSVPYALKC